MKRVRMSNSTTGAAHVELLPQMGAHKKVAVAPSSGSTATKLTIITIRFRSRSNHPKRVSLGMTLALERMRPTSIESTASKVVWYLGAKASRIC